MTLNLSADGNGSFPNLDRQPSLRQTAPRCGAAIFNCAAFDEVVELLSQGRMQFHLSALRKLFEDVVATGRPPGEVEAGAHKLASQAGMLGFEQLSACARKVENARGGAALERELASLGVAMEAASPVLDQLLAEGSGSAVQAP